MIYWRIKVDALGLFKGACISEERYKGLFYLNRCMFEPITDEDQKEMFKVLDDTYCSEKRVECLYFYSDKERDDFLKKVYVKQ